MRSHWRCVLAGLAIFVAGFRAGVSVGAWGISWLHHWEVTAGMPRSPSPDPPAWIQKAYDALPQR